MSTPDTTDAVPTPGPWFVRDANPSHCTYNIGITERSDQYGVWANEVAVIYRTSKSEEAVYLANARLIASAPELLAALRKVRDACLTNEGGGEESAYIGVTNDPHIDDELFDQLCDAINKAEGRS